MLITYDQRPVIVLAILTFKNQRAFAAWLIKNHAQSPGVSLKLGKNGSSLSVSYTEALPAALCNGWMDGQNKGFYVDR